MKRYYKYIAVGAVIFSATSCADLDTEYLGSYVSSEQKENAIIARPDLGQAGVNSISERMKSYMAVSSNHYDFGYAALMLGWDHHTADMNAGNSGYNWFGGWQAFSSPTPQGSNTNMTWYHMYQMIKIQNDVIASIGLEDLTKQDKFYVAQAYATRAHSYWVLANLYQYNYQHVDPATALCVPIITDVNTVEVATNGAPRATVQAVFDQILSDINAAITYLTESGLQPSQVIASKSKRLVSLATAYGIRARVHMTMGKYAEAYQDATAAIANHSGSAYSISDLQRPGFNNIEDGAWMWGIAVAETDLIVTSGIVNFPSHICSFAYGYVTVGGWRYCAMDLYNSIPSTDVRKGWFLDESAMSSPHLTAEEQEYLDGYLGPWTLESNQAVYTYPYTNVKYGSYEGVIGQTINASDIPLMRVEEMILTAAEAQAMSGDVASAKASLEAFIKSNRNPKYTCYATTAEELQEEVFQQRRVELWGEGLMYFEYQRLHKPVDRRLALSPTAWTYNIAANDPVRIYCIPEAEITANAQINEGDNNPSSTQPSPVKAQ